MMTGTQGSPDRSRSTWVDPELSGVEVPHGTAKKGLQPMGMWQGRRDPGVYLATTSSWMHSRASLTSFETGLANVMHALVLRSSDFCSSLP